MLYLEEGQIFDEQFQLIKLIDTGGFAEVWKALNINAGNVVALKIYPKMDEQGANSLKEEYNKLFELQHSHLLNALHFGKCKGYPYLEMRFYGGGNASERITLADESEIARCMAQVAGVLKYLHDNNIVHQDIKPNNILLDQKGNYYLADLGLSLKLRDTLQKFSQNKTQDLSSSQTGATPFAYRAPELYDRHRTDTTPIKESDIWAFGATLYEILTGEPPFGDLGGIIQNTDPFIKQLPDKYSSELYDIISSCLEKDIIKRPTAAKLEKAATKFAEFGSWKVDAAKKWQIEDFEFGNRFMQPEKTVVIKTEPIMMAALPRQDIVGAPETSTITPPVIPVKKKSTFRTIAYVIILIWLLIVLVNTCNNSL